MISRLTSGRVSSSGNDTEICDRLVGHQHLQASSLHQEFTTIGLDASDSQRTEVFNSLEWLYIEIIDTLTLQPKDSIRITLSAGPAEIANAAVLFDLVTLERLR